MKNYTDLYRWVLENKGIGEANALTVEWELQGDNQNVREETLNEVLDQGIDFESTEDPSYWFALLDELIDIENNQ